MNTPGHILIIEDDPAVARSLQDGLEREDYVVTWREAGAAGWPGKRVGKSPECK